MDFVVRSDDLACLIYDKGRVVQVVTAAIGNGTANDMNAVALCFFCQKGLCPDAIPVGKIHNIWRIKGRIPKLRQDNEAGSGSCRLFYILCC